MRTMMLPQNVFGLFVFVTVCMCISYSVSVPDSVYTIRVYVCLHPALLTHCSALMSLVRVCVSVCGASGWNIKGVR